MARVNKAMLRVRGKMAAHKRLTKRQMRTRRS